MQYTGYIKSFGNAGFIAGVNELKGMVEQGNSPEGALDKLLLALRVRTSYIEKVALSKVSAKAIPINNNSSEKKPIAEKELNLLLQS